MTESKMRELTNKAHAKPATVSDIPESDLDEVLVGVGFPPKSGHLMQNGWPANTPLEKRALEDFAAGAAQEETDQAESK